jgi:cytochrome c5
MKLAFAVFAISCLAGIGAAFAAPAAPSDAAAADAKALMETSCTMCHDIGTITSARHSEAEWDETLDRMVSNGAAISSADKAKLEAYLSATYSDKPVSPAK